MSLFPFLTSSLYANSSSSRSPLPSTLRAPWLPFSRRCLAESTEAAPKAEAEAAPKPPSKSKRDRSRHPVKAVLAGGLSGAIEISITYPTGTVLYTNMCAYITFNMLRRIVPSTFDGKGLPLRSSLTSDFCVQYARAACMFVYLYVVSELSLNRTFFFFCLVDSGASCTGLKKK